MTQQAIEILTPEGRIVGGHPMVSSIVKDTRTGQPKMQADNITPRTETYIGLAIPKAGEQSWQQTPWGQLIVQAATQGFPNGEYQGPNFAWKVADGDSQVPNQKGKRPCEREGYPGHWIINCSTGLPVKCYNVGKYDAIDQIQDQNTIKPGDYGRLLINCRSNESAQSPGVYMNPSLFELTRAGVLIVLDTGPSAAEVFGGAQATGNANPSQTPAQVNQPAGPAGPTAPAQDYPQVPAGPAAPVEVKYQTPDGKWWPKADLLKAGYTEQMLATLPQQ